MMDSRNGRFGCRHCGGFPIQFVSEEASAVGRVVEVVLFMSPPGNVEV